ncbi:unnamed protein product [Prunus armeniaca]
MAVSVLTVMVTTLVLEGWQQKLDPGYNVMQCKHCFSKLTGQSPFPTRLRG